MIYKLAAHRLVQHMLQVMEVLLTDDSTLAIFFYIHAHCDISHNGIHTPGLNCTAYNTRTLGRGIT